MATPAGAATITPGAPHHLTVAAVCAGLDTDPRRGLSSATAGSHLLRFGRNELEREVPVPLWHRFLEQLRDPLTLLLLVASALSILTWYLEGEGGWPYETSTVLAVVVLNAALALVQEGRAARAMASLASLTPPKALVLRDGVPKEVPAAEIVPGDVLLLEEGQLVPADARICESAGLRTVEATLTGESTPVTKDTAPVSENAGLADRSNMVFAGSTVVGGRGRGVVVATGMRTELGRVAGLLKTTVQEKTPLQRNLEQVASFLGKAVIAISIVVSAAMLLAAPVRDLHTFLDVLLVGVSLAVAAVPEGLATITTIVLSLGTERMARRQAVVRRLTAVEALGSASVIGSDKTGTLTRNEMTVRVVVTAAGRAELAGEGYDPAGRVLVGGQPVTDPAHAEELRRLFVAGVLANNAALVREAAGWVVRGDPTEGALKVAARKHGLDEGTLAARFMRLGEVPFSSERKLMSTAHADAEASGRRVLVSKGAPDVLLVRCTHEHVGGEERALTEGRRAEILADIESLAAEALRALGLAYRVFAEGTGPDDFTPELERELVWLGVVGMLDPPRVEAARAVAVARDAGIRTVMITGDHPKTAAAIAAELGIAPAGSRVLTGSDLQTLNAAALRAAISETNVYARVSPEHKLRIVEALQADGAVVAMTGDGVNDAPALKKADIGVAMGRTGTDVSKRAADIVLMDDNYATIVAAVEEGRAIYENIQKFLRYLLSSNAGEVLVMFLGVVGARTLGFVAADGRLVVPLLPTMILWMNLLTDAFPALALGLDPPDPDVMRRPPRDPRTPAITPRMWGDILGIGLVMAAGSLLVMDLALPGGLLGAPLADSDGAPRAQTLVFTTLVLFQLWNVFATRSDEESALRGVFTNPWIWRAVLLSLALQALAVYWPPLQRALGTVPLSGLDWGWCFAVSSSVFWLGEARKLLRRLQRRRSAGDERGR